MSNYLAVATVTAVLRDLLQEAAGEVVPGTTVTTRRPEKVEDGGQNRPLVNLFLYQVAPNAAWRNADLVVRTPDRRRAGDRAGLQAGGRPGDRIEKRPQVPLDLSYLLSFYGNEQELEPQRLLGKVVSALHARPRLSPRAIRETVARDRHLRESDLDVQVARVEHVTLTPTRLNLEELSKMWSVFFQVPYALSIAYEATVVLIEAGEPRLPAPVREVQLETETILAAAAGPAGGQP